MDKTIHIDMSGKFYKLEDIGIAYVFANDRKNHKGTALSKKIIKDLFNKYESYDYSRLNAICIYYIIKDDLKNFNKMIICDDENFSEVGQYLHILFEDGDLKEIKLEPLTHYRKELAKKIKSLAHGRARSYRKRGLKPYRWDIGTKLNVVQITYKEICNMWQKIDKELKKK